MSVLNPRGGGVISMQRHQRNEEGRTPGGDRFRLSLKKKKKKSLSLFVIHFNFVGSTSSVFHCEHHADKDQLCLSWASWSWTYSLLLSLIWWLLWGLLTASGGKLMLCHHVAQLQFQHQVPRPCWHLKRQKDFCLNEYTTVPHSSTFPVPVHSD